MFGALASMIPGAQAWPRFTRNLSEKYEARLAMVEIADSPSIFFAGDGGHAHAGRGGARRSAMPISARQGDPAQVIAAARFVDNRGAPTEAYPLQPQRQRWRPYCR